MEWQLCQVILQEMAMAMDRKAACRPTNVKATAQWFVLDVVAAGRRPKNLDRCLRALGLCWLKEAGDGDMALVIKKQNTKLTDLARLYLSWVTMQVGASLLGFRRVEVGKLWDDRWAKKMRKLAAELRQLFPNRTPPLPRQDGLFMDPEELEGLLF